MLGVSMLVTPTSIAWMENSTMNTIMAVSFRTSSKPFKVDNDATMTSKNNDSQEAWTCKNGRLKALGVP
jgi:hypothetical protein